MFVMHPVAKPYAWGSHTRLQTMFSTTPEAGLEGPLAEMWFSGHQQWPSSIDMTTGDRTPLTSLIQGDPGRLVGPRDSARFGPVLPYLLKVISARIPLSLQVHPVAFEARAGFNAENAAGIPLDDPKRSFRDAVEKCEMIVALEPFEAVVGFAPIPSMLRNLRLVDHPVARVMVDALSRRFSMRASGQEDFSEAEAMMPMSAAVWPESSRQVFRAFHAAVTAAPDSGLIDALIDAGGRAMLPHSRLSFAYAVAAARDFPDDPSVLSLLMLNPVSLDEGESVFIPAGTPHAYIHGTGVEIMTNSDNVLRAGMTVKHKDIRNLLHTLNCAPSAPIDPVAKNLVTLMMRDTVVYKPGVEAFMLAYGHVDERHGQWAMPERLIRRYGKLIRQIGVERTIPAEAGPRVLLCTQGRIRCSSPRDERVLRCGEAVFIPACEGAISVSAVGGDSTNNRVAQTDMRSFAGGEGVAGGVEVDGEPSSGSYVVASTQL
ncbi:mannose-6-phosphate isomerase, class I [Bifidobacterium mongoliense]|uniref:mannose-6-phosphate isomerase, class I n=1 Tax=Bifidobacterium mongoliense TaxID=518643 RepID=UPI003899857D